MTGACDNVESDLRFRHLTVRGAQDKLADLRKQLNDIRDNVSRDG